MQGLGEVLNAKRPWYPGTPPAVLPDKRQLGRPGCMVAGDNEADGIPYDDCIDGIPPACFSPQVPDKWPDVSTFTRCSLQRFYAKIIEWLYDDEGGRIVEAFKLLLGIAAVVTVRTQAGNFPAMATAKLGSIFICVLDGTRTFQQLALQALDSISSPQDFGVLETMPFWYGASIYITGKMAEDGLAANDRVFLAGHSYGAAVACITAARLKAWDAMADVRYLTYGCPKPGGVKLQALLRSIEGVNLANHNDIITVLPPDQATLAPVMIALGAPQLAVWLYWLRPENQLGIYADGTTDANAFPLLDYSTLLNIAEQVLLGDPIAAVTGHPITEYYRRLTLRCPDAEWPVSKELEEWIDARPLGLLSITVPYGAMGLRSMPIGKGALGFTDVMRLQGQLALQSVAQAGGELGLMSPASGGGELGLMAVEAASPGELGLISPAAAGGGELGLISPDTGEGEVGLGE